MSDNQLRPLFDRSGRRWRTFLLRATLILLAAALITSYAYLSNERRAAALATGLIETAMPVRVAIEEARFALNGTVELEGVELQVDGMEEAGQKIFAAQHISIEHNLLGLFRRRFLPTRIVLKQPALFVTEDAVTGRVNLESLFGEAAAEPMPDRFPAIFIDEGLVQRGEIRDGEYRRLARIESMAGSLLETEPGSGTYAFRIGQALTDGGKGPMFSGQIDLHRSGTYARLDGLPFDSPLWDLLPQRLRDMWDRLEPSGTLTTGSFEYDGGGDAGVRAIFDLEDSSITLPVTEPPTQLVGVAGRILVEAGRVTPDLTGRIHHDAPRIDADCRIKGWMGPFATGFDTEVPFRLEIQARGDIPAQPSTGRTIEQRRDLPPTSKVLDWLHRWFDPAGTLVADVVIERAERGHLVPQIFGSVQLSGNGQFLLFPYPLQEVSGQLVLNGDSLDVVGLRGSGPGVARMEVGGVVGPLRLFPAVEMTVEGWDIPIDETLFKAIRMKRPDTIRAIDMFMDEKAFASLRRRLVAAAPCPDAEGGAPSPSVASACDALVTQLDAFRPGGNVSHLHADIRRDTGRDARVDLQTRLDMQGVAIMFRHWPYPLRATGGHLLVSDRHILAVGITGHGPDSRSRFTLDGEIHRDGVGWADADIALKVTATDVPLDVFLLNTVPEAQARMLETMELEGRGSAEATISRNAEGQIHYEINARLDDGRARPFGGRFVVEDLGERHISGPAWDLTITPGRVTFHDVQGRVSTQLDGSAGHVTLSGSIDWREGHFSYDVEVAVEQFFLDEAILDLFPPGDPRLDRLRRRFDEHRPEGLVNGRLRLVSGEEESLTYTLHLEPQSISLLIGGRRVRAEGMSGSVHAADDRLKLEALGGTFAEEGSFEINGTVSLGRTHDADLRFVAASGALDETVRAVLPVAVLKMIDAMRLQGGFRLEDGSLLWRPGATNGDALKYRFESTIHLQDAQAVLGIPVQQIDGSVKVSSQQKVAAAWPVIAMQVEADQLHVTGRRVSPLTMEVATDVSYPDRLRLKKARGTCYGGTIVGDGWIDLAEGGAYHADMTISGAQLAPILEPDVGDGQAGRTRSKGVLDALLAVEGLLSDPSSQRGRGALAVREAQLYEVPLAMGLLQVVSLDLPSSGRFEHAQIDYGIDGDAIRFDRMRLAGPTVEMEGTGTMSYSTRRIDLTLALRRPDNLWDNPVTELLEMVKDELVTIHVTGTVEAPQPRVQSLRGIRQSWNSIFGPPPRR